MPQKKTGPTAQSPAMFVTWEAGDENGKRVAIATASKGYRDVTSVVTRSVAAGTYRNVDTPSVSVRDGFNRNDYDYFRPGERLPTDDKGVQMACLQAYKKFAIVRNVVDLMTDFVVKGLDVVHPSPRVEKFAKEWFHKKVKGRKVSRKIAKMLFRAGAAPVSRRTVKLADATLDELRTMGGARDTALPPGELPAGYTVLNPVSVEAVGAELSAFVDLDAVRYAVRVPQSLSTKLKKPDGVLESGLVTLLPSTVLKAATSGTRLVPLNPKKTVVVHYDKDDHEVWGVPILASLLDDLQMLEKLKMADRSALDGAISHVRLWRLGNLENRIFPTPEAVQRLADMLLHSVGGGCMDLIWGPELDLIETGSDICSVLGNEKYVPTMASIFQGLGVPPTLTGTMSDAGMTNNFVSVRILVERLECCRGVLEEFWGEELAVLQKTFGFRQPFRLAWGVPELSDDSAEKKLLIDMVDRDLLSPEFVQRRFGADPDIENARLRRDARRRKDGVGLPKAGPYHADSRQQADLQKGFAASGEVTPSEVGVELKPRKPGEVPAAARKDAMQAAKIANKGGRPKGANDTSKRKKKRVAPKQSSASAELARAVLWAEAASKAVEEHARLPFLRAKGKKTARQLTVAESETYERVKFALLCAHKPGDAVTADSVRAALAAKPAVPFPVNQLFKATCAKYAAEHGAAPPADVERQIRATAYALYAFDIGRPDDGVIDNEDQE